MGILSFTLPSWVWHNTVAPVGTTNTQQAHSSCYSNSTNAFHNSQHIANIVSRCVCEYSIGQRAYLILNCESKLLQLNLIKLDVANTFKWGIIVSNIWQIALEYKNCSLGLCLPDHRRGTQSLKHFYARWQYLLISCNTQCCAPDLDTNKQQTANARRWLCSRGCVTQRIILLFSPLCIIMFCELWEAHQ